MLSDLLKYILQIALISFMLGSLVDVGLKLEVRDAVAALRDRHFVVASVLSAFLVGPLLAVLIVWALALPQPYALGLLLLGFAPCAPFMPALSDLAKADSAYAAAFIMIAALGTIVVMPFAVPFVAPELDAGVGSIARPLLLLVLAPFAAGIAFRRLSARWADRCHPIMKTLVTLNILLLLIIAIAQNWRDVIGAVGTWAIAAQFIYYCGLAICSYAISLKLPLDRRGVVTLGVCTRNVGAALAPLSAVSNADPRSSTMCILAAFITLLVGFLVAKLLARLETKGRLEMTEA
ncbi:bile acid:sodium symporter family protein [Rhizobium sp. WYJ-E13]|uniref:bile acid:sodium symporter family protein n=1 Tax=Rhizobium sp. WYJ-E13 TaxID=2849093 RepID=UPI001C1EECD0|nr:bile acid:sodium symporter [Rhizobium sp. WYJ-E13]QWW71151.1 bile acid:sodium symporter [Rhizobium sp. WYJ-E13]